MPSASSCLLHVFCFAEYQTESKCSETFCGFFFPKIIYIPKKISVSFYPVWTPFDMDILRNKKHATNRNWHWALDQYVSPKNSIKRCQKVYESCIILAWNNQKLWIRRRRISIPKLNSCSSSSR